MQNFKQQTSKKKYTKSLCMLLCAIFAVLLLLTGCSRANTNENTNNSGNSNVVLPSDSNNGTDAEDNNLTDESSDPEDNQISDSNIIPDDSSFFIRFIDVGQADSALVS